MKKFPANTGRPKCVLFQTFKIIWCGTNPTLSYLVHFDGRNICSYSFATQEIFISIHSGQNKYLFITKEKKKSLLLSNRAEKWRSAHLPFKADEHEKLYITRKLNFIYLYRQWEIFHWNVSYLNIP